jgi:hypothetical protein
MVVTPATEKTCHCSPSPLRCRMIFIRRSLSLTQFLDGRDDGSRDDNQTLDAFVLLVDLFRLFFDDLLDASKPSSGGLMIQFSPVGAGI